MLLNNKELTWLRVKIFLAAMSGDKSYRLQLREYQLKQKKILREKIRFQIMQKGKPEEKEFLLNRV